MTTATTQNHTNTHSKGNAMTIQLTTVTRRPTTDRRPRHGSPCGAAALCAVRVLAPRLGDGDPICPMTGTTNCNGADARKCPAC